MKSGLCPCACMLARPCHSACTLPAMPGYTVGPSSLCNEAGKDLYHALRASCTAALALQKREAKDAKLQGKLAKLVAEVCFSGAGSGGISWIQHCFCPQAFTTASLIAEAMSVMPAHVEPAGKSACDAGDACADRLERVWSSMRPRKFFLHCTQASHAPNLQALCAEGRRGCSSGSTEARD